MKMSKNIVLGMAGVMLLSGMAPVIPGTPLQELVPIVKAEDKSPVYTQGGVAVLGNREAVITIKGNEGQNLVGKKFRIYQLFLAENARDGESVNYTWNSNCETALKNVTAKALTKKGKKTIPEQVTEYMAIDYIQSLNANQVEGAKAEQKEEGTYSEFRYFVEELRDELEKLSVNSDCVEVRGVRPDNVIQIRGMAYGYYIIDEVTDVSNTSSASSLCMVNTANPTASISIKSDYPVIAKQVQEDEANENIKDPNRWNDIGDFEIGQFVPYRYESNISNMNGYRTYYYAWHDRMDDALTFLKDTVKITISGNISDTRKKEYTLKESEYLLNTMPSNGDTFQISIPDIKSIVDREFPRFNSEQENIYDQKVTLSYKAILNDRAVQKIGRPGIENDVRLEFSNNPDSNDGGSSRGFTPWDTVVCFTYKLQVQKVNNYQKTLAGAKFRLYSDEACQNEVYVRKEKEGYAVVNRDAVGGTDHVGGNKFERAVEMVSPENGQFEIYGLDSGTYYLKETKAPAGYRLLKDPVKLEIKAIFTDDRDHYVKGSGANDTVLKNLNVKAKVDSFYSGIIHSEEKELKTNAEEGTINLTVINQVGSKLPVTGTPVVLIMVLSGSILMTVAVLSSKRKR